MLLWVGSASSLPRTADVRQAFDAGRHDKSLIDRYGQAAVRVRLLYFETGHSRGNFQTAVMTGSGRELSVMNGRFREAQSLADGLPRWVRRLRRLKSRAMPTSKQTPRIGRPRDSAAACWSAEKCFTLSTPTPPHDDTMTGLPRIEASVRAAG